MIQTTPLVFLRKNCGQVEPALLPVRTNGKQLSSNSQTAKITWSAGAVESSDLIQ
jgi:hypothetical protein